jgi:hypothetical protein
MRAGRLQVAGEDLRLAADKRRENAKDISFMQMTILRGEDAVDQNDSGELIGQAERLDELLDGPVFVDIHAEGPLCGVCRGPVSKCGKEPDRDVHASLFRFSASGEGRGKIRTRSTARLVASSTSSINPSCMSNSPRWGIRSS